MGRIRDALNKIRGSPEFEVDARYYNKDAGQEIIVREKQEDHLIVEYTAGEYEVPANRDLYRHKLANDIIIKL